MTSYERFDRAIYRIERGIVIVALLVMSVVVFLDVVHRGFAGVDSPLTKAVAKVAGMFGMAMPPESAAYQRLAAASPYIVAASAVLLGFVGLRTARVRVPVSARKALLLSVLGTAVVYGLVRLLVLGMPNGLVWSQPVALVLTLWVGFVGASMCTYENKHLRVEAVQRHLPLRIRPAVDATSALLTTTVCAALAWLSLRNIVFHWVQYQQTSGQGGLMEGTNVPKWAAFSALPVAFGFMALRFGARGVAAMRGKVEEIDLTGGLLPPPSHGIAPSDVETEAMRVGPRPSEIDTVSSARNDVDLLPPSHVQTDRHEIGDRPRDQAGELGSPAPEPEPESATRDEGDPR